MIAYTPDELIALANKEFAWCDRECSVRPARWASARIGEGAGSGQEQVRGAGPDDLLVRDLSREAVEFLEKRELVTLPPMLKEDYWEEAMTPQMQLVNPFFTRRRDYPVSSPASSQNADGEAGGPARQQYVLRARHRVP